MRACFASEKTSLATAKGVFGMRIVDLRLPSYFCINGVRRWKIGIVPVFKVFPLPRMRRRQIRPTYGARDQTQSVALAMTTRCFTPRRQQQAYDFLH